MHDCYCYIEFGDVKPSVEEFKRCYMCSASCTSSEDLLVVCEDLIATIYSGDVELVGGISSRVLAV